MFNFKYQDLVHIISESLREKDKEVNQVFILKRMRERNKTIEQRNNQILSITKISAHFFSSIFKKKIKILKFKQFLFLIFCFSFSEKAHSISLLFDSLIFIKKCNRANFPLKSLTNFFHYQRYSSSAEPNEECINIVGGGIGGLASAFALGKQGYQINVLERSSQFLEAGAGMQLGPNTLKALELLGVEKEIKEASFFPPHLRMMDALSGKEIFQLNTQALYHIYGYPYVVIHRQDLHSILLKACSRLPNIKLSLNSCVTSFWQNEESVTINLQNERSFNGKGLIGADGIHSALRKFIIDDSDLNFSGTVSYRAVLPRQQVPDKLWSPDVILWAGPQFHLVHYPICSGKLFNIAAIINNEGKLSTGKEAITALFEKFSVAQPILLELLQKIETHKVWPVNDRDPVKNWTKGRVTLLGDAAHPMFQYAAQGAGMAIEDAVVLAQAVKLYSNDFQKAFEVYQNLRYPRTARVQLTSRFYGEIYHASGIKKEIRNELFKSISINKEMPGVFGLDWLYRGIDIQSLIKPHEQIYEEENDFKELYRNHKINLSL